MIQFNAQQIANIRQRATTPFIDKLIEENSVILDSETLVPPDGRATWNLYYFCPDHAVRLTWDRHCSTEHVCPVDGNVFTGEPYDGAWWRGLNGLNAKACNQLGLLWQITQNPQYLNKVTEILLEYAKYYPDYQEHGGIPYNGPGKANAQTLCEANCHLDFALGYDFIRDDLTKEQRQLIEIRLLREGAEFLMQHRSDQLHNHEMKINATIGVIGLILNEEKFIKFAINTKYGIKYQLDHGVIGEGLWFEGSIHYHYYALQAMMAFEKLARKTPHSLASHPKFQTMLSFPLKLILNNGDFPKLNDCIAGQEKLTHTHLFEYAYAEFHDEIYASALQQIYQSQARDNIDALLYGVDALPKVAPLTCQSIHAPKVGLTLLKSATNHAMLLKHAPYGGEHDHYDRLGLILIKNGLEILPDLGTTGYGAKLHYGYYKNSATHNTLVVNQANQTPINPKVINFIKNNAFAFIDALVDWSEKPASVDSHTLMHWDQEAYQDIQFRRSILWLGNTAIEINQIENPHQQQLDLTWHTRGRLKTHTHLIDIENPLTGPLSIMNECMQMKIPHEFMDVFSYAIENEDDYYQQIYALGANAILTGQAPDNPATQNLSYLLLRSKQKNLRSITLHNLSLNHQLEYIDWQENTLNFKVTNEQTRISFRLDFTNNTINII